MLLRLVLCLGLAAAAFPQPANPERHAKAIAAFLEQDRVSPPPRQGILFIGSSIFRQWAQLTTHMAPLPVFNRAFGGSQTYEILHYMDRVVLPYEPAIIVYYCGSNDLKAGTTPEDPAAIFARFREFSERVRRDLPETRLIFAAATRSPDRVPRWEQVDHYNALARAYCATTPHRFFVDLNPLLVDADGRPRLELYVADKLHFQPEAYTAFAGRLKPVLERVWAEANGRATPAAR